MAQALPFIYYAALVGTTYATVRSSQNAAKAQSIALKEQAKDEQTAARDREIERRRNLVQALSSQAAEAGAMGVNQAVGSRKAIALSDARAASYDSLVDSTRTNRRALLLRSQARNARRQGDLQSAGILLGAAGDAAEFETSRRKNK